MDTSSYADARTTFLHADPCCQKSLENLLIQIQNLLNVNQHLLSILFL